MLRFRVRPKFDFGGAFIRNLAVLAAEGRFLGPSEKVDGEGWAGYCNMRRKERWGLVDNHR